MQFGRPGDTAEGSSTISVHFPTDQTTIFNALVNPAVWARLVGKEPSSTKAPQSIGIGAQWMERFGPFGIYKITKTLIEYDPPRKFVRKIRGSIISDVEYSFEPHRDGTTVTIRFNTKKVPFMLTKKAYHESQREIFEGLRGQLENRR